MRIFMTTQFLSILCSSADSSLNLLHKTLETNTFVESNHLTHFKEM